MIDPEWQFNCNLSGTASVRYSPVSKKLFFGAVFFIAPIKNDQEEQKMTNVIFLKGTKQTFPFKMVAKANRREGVYNRAG